MVFSEKQDLKGGEMAMSSELSPNFGAKYPDSIGSGLLSIAVIGPDEGRRKAISSALAKCPGAEVREFSSYPTSLDEVPRLLKQYYDLILIDLDSDREFALELVESICATESATVMVYSELADRDGVFVACVRALVSFLLRLSTKTHWLKLSSGPRPSIVRKLTPQRNRAASCWCFSAPRAAPA